MKKLFTLILFFLPHLVYSQTVVLNEIMSSNSITIYDEDGDASDWIELYNSGTSQVSLEGYYLSDNLLDIKKWRFGSAVIDPGEYLIVFASSKDTVIDYWHTNFNISSSGEEIILSDSSGLIIDSVYVPASISDVSYARESDGSLPWIFQVPSPGSQNAGQAIQDYADPVSSSLPGGFYPSAVSVELSAGTNDIYYTLDGSDPDSNSFQYATPINITETTVLKALSMKEGYLPSPTTHQSYFINEQTDLPVISLIADPYILFDPDSGIYTNYKMDWERPAHVQFFEDNKSMGFSENCGIEIHGSQSAEWAQKSIAVKFKNRYGVTGIEYPLFPDFWLTKLKAFILRNAGNDWQYTHIRDAVMQTLIRDLDIDYQEYRPATSFINGEYWGIYNIREKINEHYVANRHGVDPDNIDMLENNMEVIHGDSLSYQKLIDYISTNDMTTEDAYTYLDSVIDLDECILYFSAQAYYDNLDWPGTNIKFWRERSTTGKWRWLLFGVEFGFGLYAHGPWEDHIEFMFSPVETRYSNPPWATLLQRKLVENPTIRNRFINQIADLLNTNFKSERVLEVINSIANHISNELPKHRARWGLGGENLDKMTSFAEERPAYMRNHVRNYFQCGEDGTLTINASTGGSVQLNTLELQSVDMPFSGIYFQGNEIHLEAIPASGYKFDGWSGAVTSNEETITISVSGSTTLQASFSVDSSGVEAIVINEINYNSADDFESGDWVELYNNSDQSIDISNWFFSDSDSSHKFIFSNGTIIEPDGYLVVIDNDSAFTDRFPDVQNYIGETGFGLSGSGEFMKLVSGAGEIIDSLTYDDNSPWPEAADGGGASLELINPVSDNSIAESWKASLEHGTPGKLNSVDSSDVKEIVINEINYNSADDFESGDWIELYNNSNQPIDISNWYFSDSDSSHKFIFPNGTIIEPDGYLVVIDNDSAFTDRFPDVQNYTGETGFGLSGSGEFMKLVNDAGEIIDSLTYDDNSPWPEEPDGNGASLELIDADSDNSIAENWKASLEHGTPGKLNSAITSVEDDEYTRIPSEYTLFQNYPNPFNPSTTIVYSLPRKSFITLKVYNLLGQEVASLFEGFRQSGKYTATFDGSYLSSGVYLFRLETENYVETKKLVLLK